MTSEEADKIAAIGARVDGGCSVCVRNFTERCMRDFPDHDWKARMRAMAKRNSNYWHDEVDTWEAAGDE